VCGVSLVSQYARHLRRFVIDDTCRCLPLSISEKQIGRNKGISATAMHHQRICYTRVVSNNIATFEHGHVTGGDIVLLMKHRDLVPLHLPLMNEWRRCQHLTSLIIPIPQWTHEFDEIANQLVNLLLDIQKRCQISTMMNGVMSRSNNGKGNGKSRGGDGSGNDGMGSLQHLKIPLAMIWSVKAWPRREAIDSNKWIDTEERLTVSQSLRNTLFNTNDEHNNNVFISSLRHLHLIDHSNESTCISPRTMHCIDKLTNLTSLTLPLSCMISYDASESFMKLIHLHTFTVEQARAVDLPSIFDDDTQLDRDEPISFGSLTWNLPTSLHQINYEGDSVDTLPRMLLHARNLRKWNSSHLMSSLQLKLLMTTPTLSSSLTAVHLGRIVDVATFSDESSRAIIDQEWIDISSKWLHDLIPSTMLPTYTAQPGSSSTSTSSTGVWPLLCNFHCYSAIPLPMLYATVLPIRNQLTTIFIICPQICVDHVATILTNNAMTLEEVRISIASPFHEDDFDDRSRNMTSIAPSDGSFTQWSSLSKSGSLIMPRLTTIELEIGSSTLINALYCPSLGHMHLTGTAAVRPLPLIHNMAPICTSITIDLWYYYKHVHCSSDDEKKAEPNDDDDEDDDEGDNEEEVDDTGRSKEGKPKKTKATTPKGEEDVTMKQQECIFVPCPIPNTSIIDDPFIDELLASLAKGRGVAIGGGHQLDSIVIRIGRGYMKLSQLQRIVDYLTSSSSLPASRSSSSSSSLSPKGREPWKYSVADKLFGVVGQQPLIIDASKEHTIEMKNKGKRGKQSHQGHVGQHLVKDEYIVATLSDMIITLARWLLPRSLSVDIWLPSLVFQESTSLFELNKPPFMKVLLDGLRPKFDSLLSIPFDNDDGHVSSPLTIQIGLDDVIGRSKDDNDSDDEDGYNSNCD
jgi:hypothetical protein